MNFSELGLDPLVLKAVEAAGYSDPTPVQAQAVPAALTGADLLVSAQTGSGKTAAFMLPSLCRLVEPAAAKGYGPRILVLTPTRELALQVEKAAGIYGRELRKLRTACLVGGAPYGPQLKQLSQPVDVVVATPGRLMDHMERGKIDFDRLEVLVLDEADRMLDMGFVDDIKAIVAKTPATRQTMMFSATLDGVVGRLARELTRDAQRIEVTRSEDPEAKIEQKLHFFDDPSHKMRLLDALVRDASLNQAIVFTATKAGAEDLSEELRDRGFLAEALHGDMPQHKRNRTLDRVRSGRTQFLVATDVAARGIDVAGISHVINYDAPRQAEDYVHRIGRTGRAGRSGVAVTLVSFRDHQLVRNIERYTGHTLAVTTIPGLEPTARPSRPRPEGGKSWGDKPGYKGKRPGGSGDWKAKSGGWKEGSRGKPWADKPGYKAGGDKPHPAAAAGLQPAHKPQANDKPRRAERFW
ncbi:MAG: RNA helicase [Hydrogenophilales bacterium CG03_land_8_20_14_0_80_62_28]|nr:DEAD/DEAH box helicase [Betaproteobacteria bacterium]PIV23605.1 MAG: RNA helicase [Hydrogenophilales bacterium CG03_land_8_20_14_0_80_62_28]PIW38860.1 MAG: RNA helicase [Hydrogenophilales bacterium CG15_BIG_FIL_POST_REV_8_21_14_020_62_31]PIW72668.1 MAG: RNA helicase [Hydrogenophilales bacterium CG12_big_fil_rev_8_21_14_0_65_61_21]PIX01469.1 MAG: RNA helicase [Hydrogenophilales bacterium CG_4_8_14_3_um_filter_62_83]